MEHSVDDCNQANNNSKLDRITIWKHQQHSNNQHKKVNNAASKYRNIVRRTAIISTDKFQISVIC